MFCSDVYCLVVNESDSLTTQDRISCFIFCCFLVDKKLVPHCQALVVQKLACALPYHINHHPADTVLELNGRPLVKNE